MVKSSSMLRFFFWVVIKSDLVTKCPRGLWVIPRKTSINDFLQDFQKCYEHIKITWFHTKEKTKSNKMMNSVKFIEKSLVKLKVHDFMKSEGKQKKVCWISWFPIFWSNKSHNMSYT